MNNLREYIFVIIVTALGLNQLMSSKADAASITVNSASAGTGGPSCTLRDAIDAANTDLAKGGCTAGSGTDIIDLQAGGPYTLVTADNDIDGANGLPSVESTMTINGNGEAIQREPSATGFRIFHIASTGNLTLDKVTISGGSAEMGDGSTNNDNGAGVYNRGTLTLIESTVTANGIGGRFSPNIVPNGGGIHNNNGVLTLVNSTVSGNEAFFAGGIGSFGFTTAIINVTGSTISGNLSNADDGGGIRSSSPLNLTNSTVSGNEKGGIHNSGGSGNMITLTNSTVFANTGAGISTVVGGVELTNTIIAGNTIDCTDSAAGDVDLTSSGHNIDSDNTCNLTEPTDLLNTDPLLDSLADNGGFTLTHALLDGSPAIDAGNCSGGTISIDQRGVSRAQGMDCDIGAFEIDSGPADIDEDGILDDIDNCPDDANPNQNDNDLDGEGDACDTDDDNDTVPDTADNCQFTDNTDQSDIDTDGLGDVCDADPDGDGVEEFDNCPLTPNPFQDNSDNDGQGDACDDDDDNDGICDAGQNQTGCIAGPDNCAVNPNFGQADLDGDSIGDVCDADLDGDGIDNGVDNCPMDANTGQDDTDGDGNGNACDSDDDDDGIADGVDNCPMVSNIDQSDEDDDGAGDACDGDLDGDGVENEMDNCPINANSSQNDLDLDGLGDVCDPDIDGDDVANGIDDCPGTPLDSLVNLSNGCTVDELCPCGGPRGTNQPWKNHGKYVSCIAHAATQFENLGLINETEKGDIISAAAQSECGNKK